MLILIKIKKIIKKNLLLKLKKKILSLFNKLTAIK